MVIPGLGHIRCGISRIAGLVSHVLTSMAVMRVAAGPRAGRFNIAHGVSPNEKQSLVAD
jgi:hypothetical protein